MLNVEGLTVCRGSHRILEDITFSLPPGQLTAVLGLNGAGKTTLLKAILGFLPREGGRVSVDGREVDRLSPADRAKRLAYVPQNPDGGFRYSVEEFVSMGVTAYLGAFSRPGRESVRRAEEILAGLDCGHLIGRPMDRLSGGENRLAYLARAILQDAGFLLLDEPAASLDFSRQHGFLSSLRSYVGERRAGCLLTVHAPELAYAYADRVLILRGGRLLLDSSRSDPEFDEQVCRGLEELYGPAVQVSVRDGTLILGWKNEIFGR